MVQVRPVDNREQVEQCYAVMAQLRPHLSLDEFMRRVDTQKQEGYRLACVVDNDDVVAVAGFRISHNLAWGKFLYVDDLVTHEDKRSQGHGALLLSWLMDEAKRNNCAALHLDSGVQRKDAHRFYENAGMTLSAYHFNIDIAR